MKNSYSNEARLGSWNAGKHWLRGCDGIYCRAVLKVAGECADLVTGWVIVVCLGRTRTILFAFLFVCLFVLSTQRTGSVVAVWLSFQTWKGHKTSIPRAFLSSVSLPPSAVSATCTEVSVPLLPLVPFMLGLLTYLLHGAESFLSSWLACS